MLRSSRGPLHRLWRAAYAVAVRTVAGYLRWRDPDVSVYLTGSLGRGEPVWGLSDLDIVAVAPSDPLRPGLGRRRLELRQDRIVRTLAMTRQLVSDMLVCEQQELERALAQTVFTGSGDGAAEILAPAQTTKAIRLRERPGLAAPLDDWQLVAGPERRPSTVGAGPAHRHLVAWLELHYWWRRAFEGSLEPDALNTSYLCVKLVSAAVQTWLWIEGIAAVGSRREALMLGLRAMPEEDQAIIHRALALDAMLHRLPEAPLEDALTMLSRTSVRIAARLQASADQAAETQVRLVGSSDELCLSGDEWTPSIVPLVDWRAIVAPRVPDEGLMPAAGDPSDPRTVATVAQTAPAGVAHALRSGPLVVKPTTGRFAEAFLRAVQCPVTDPVTHALLAGHSTATFPELPGLSAGDISRRAIAEHAAWLRRPRSRPRPYARVDAPQPVIDVSRLLTAARAAVFAQSLAREEPALPVTIASTASLTNDAQLAEAIASGCNAFRVWHRHRTPPPGSVALELRRAVVKLEPYRARQSSPGASDPSGDR